MQLSPAICDAPRCERVDGRFIRVDAVRTTPKRHAALTANQRIARSHVWCRAEQGIQH